MRNYHRVRVQEKSFLLFYFQIASSNLSENEDSWKSFGFRKFVIFSCTGLAISWIPDFFTHRNKLGNETFMTRVT